MKFLDANVFVYAYYKPRKQLSQKEIDMKEAAQRIIANIFEGKDRVLTSVVHLSEVVNILKHGFPTDQVSEIMRGVFMLENVIVADVTRDIYFAANELGDNLRLDANDALAVDIMKLNGISEIYSFDEDFDKVEGIRRISSS
ncbi:MAG: type II toxin-antitoxin system VapC family toxin [Candidatus Bathyarchaeia archaeon]